MPRDMFGDVVDPSIKVGGQKWYTVPLSIIVHVVLIGSIIIVPLMAGLRVMMVSIAVFRPVQVFFVVGALAIWIASPRPPQSAPGS